MKTTATILMTALLLVLGTAFAQIEDDDELVVVVDDTVTEDFWVGLSAGYPGVNLHFGINNAISQDIDIRSDLGITYFGGFTFGANALFGLPVEVDPDVALSFYAGGGPVIDFIGDVDFGVDLLAGGEYRFREIDFNSGGIFFEAGPRLIFSGFDADFLARLGFNYHF